MKEMTKVVMKQCDDCHGMVQVLCNESSQIIAVRCSDCLEKWYEKNKEYNEKYFSSKLQGEKHVSR